MIKLVTYFTTIPSPVRLNISIKKEPNKIAAKIAVHLKIIKISEIAFKCNFFKISSKIQHIKAITPTTSETEKKKTNS